MKKIGFIFLVFLIMIACAPDTSTLSGKVTDKSTGDPLPDVQIVIQWTGEAIQTDAQGEYELSGITLQDYNVLYIHENYDTLKVHAYEMHYGEHYRIDVALE